jgi:hypothetical protein
LNYLRWSNEQQAEHDLRPNGRVGPNPHFSPIDFFLGLRQFGGLLEMLEASNRVY